MDNIEIVTTGQTIQEQDKQSVLQLAPELDRRWNERNAVAFAEMFAPRGDFRWQTGAWMVGKDSSLRNSGVTRSSPDSSKAPAI